MAQYFVPVVTSPASDDYVMLERSPGQNNKISVSDLSIAIAGPGGSTVTSVNGDIGAVVLDADDLSDTSTAHKFTTAADIAKLAGITAGAQPNESAAAILAKLLTVDGAGSGLDADLLDGISSAGFYQPGGTDVAVADGGTGSSTPTAARTALGVAIGTDVQAFSSVLAATTASYTTAEQTKLSGVATGAQVNDTAAQILTKLLTVDGAGSGLDADLLDGISSAGFDAAGAATAAQSAAIAVSAQRASNLSDLANAATARTNLGLGTAATTASTAYDAAGAATTAQAAAIAASAQRASNLSDLASAGTARTNLGLGGLAVKSAVAVPGDITATGTPSSSSYLRGDGTWATPAGAGGDMVAANNLSDVVNKATGRTNLGVAIGTNVQAWDADLDLLAAVTVPASTILGRGAAGAVAALTPAQAGTVLGLGTAALTSSTAYDAAGAATTAQAAAIAASAQRASNLSDLANAATARTNLGLGTIATQAASAVAITGGAVTGITDLAVADGGTGASTASAARTNLGLVIGTDVQGLFRTTGSGAPAGVGGFGAEYYDTVAKRLYLSDGTSWIILAEPWQVQGVAGVTSVFGFSGVSGGGLSTTAAYHRRDGTIEFRITAAFTGLPTVSSPAVTSTIGLQDVRSNQFNIALNDSGTIYPGTHYGASGSSASFALFGLSAASASVVFSTLTATAPFTIGSGDTWEISGTAQMNSRYS